MGNIKSYITIIFSQANFSSNFLSPTESEIHFPAFSSLVCFAFIVTSPQ